MVAKHDDHSVVLEPKALQGREHPSDVEVGVADGSVVAPPKNPGPGHVGCTVGRDVEAVYVGGVVPGHRRHVHRGVWDG